jgi:hypothetical protein
MKPNYSAMSWTELRAYILAHRDDLDALEAMYDRRSPDSEAVWFAPPKTPEEEHQQFELFQQMLRDCSPQP